MLGGARLDCDMPAAVAWHFLAAGMMAEASDPIRINRAPVLTLWAAVVAERIGFDRDTALTLGQAVAGLSAYAKGVSLGIIEPSPDLVRERGERLGEGEQLHVDLLGRAVPWCVHPTGCEPSTRASPATRPASRSTSPASSGRGSMTHGPRWRTDGGPGAGRTLSARVQAVRAVSARGAAGRVGMGRKGRAGSAKVRAADGKLQT